MNELNMLLGQGFKHMAGSEEAAEKIVAQYKDKYGELKKSTINKKTKKGIDYWVVNIDVSHVEEKDAWEMNFGE